MIDSVWRGKKIVLGVTGGIAAYKAAEIASRLTKSGGEVHVIMTRAAENFIAPLTFREISKQAVHTGMWNPVAEYNVEHIALANLADLVLVAPATANVIAKLAHGLADDMLTTVILATKAPVVIAPAMNTDMYQNPLTQRNLKLLQEVGFRIIEPATGALACGASGIGRLPEPREVVARAAEFLPRPKPLAGKKIIVTAGGTVAGIDPVRFIGNRSSGKMGYAAAEAAAWRGAEVTLVSAPTNLEKPLGVKFIGIETAEEMREAVLAEYAEAAAVIMAAAVADYRVKEPSGQKVKKTADDWQLELTRGPDILFELGQKKRPGQILVGFAAETENLLVYAKEKLRRKNLDFIVANDVTKPGAGFNTDTNLACIIEADGGAREYPLMDKAALAGIILDKIERRL